MEPRQPEITYHITTISDLFSVANTDNVHRLCQDLVMALQSHCRLKKITGQEVECKTLHWTDDRIVQTTFFCAGESKVPRTVHYADDSSVEGAAGGNLNTAPAATTATHTASTAHVHNSRYGTNYPNYSTNPNHNTNYPTNNHTMYNKESTNNTAVQYYPRNGDPV